MLMISQSLHTIQPQQCKDDLTLSSHRWFCPSCPPLGSYNQEMATSRRLVSLVLGTQLGKIHKASDCQMSKWNCKMNNKEGIFHVPIVLP